LDLIGLISRAFLGSSSAYEGMDIGCNFILRLEKEDGNLGEMDERRVRWSDDFFPEKWRRVNE